MIRLPSILVIDDQGISSCLRRADAEPVEVAGLADAERGDLERGRR